MFTEKIGKRISPAPRAALVLCAALTMWALVLAVSPATARAQTSAKAQATEAANDEAQGARGAAAAESSVVVEPGDSLWSISEDRLGPGATPRRVMKGAERIHALNRARIGADPDLIFVGQGISLPPAMSGPPNGATVPAPKAAEASGSGPRDRAARGPAGKKAPRKAAGRGAIPRSGITLEEAAEMLGADPEGKGTLPEPRAAAPVPDVRAVASDGSPTSAVASFLGKLRTGVASAASAPAEVFFAVSAEAGTEGRRLIGFGVLIGVLMLTLTVAALAAGRRKARRREARRREAWFRETYGRLYAASHLSAGQEDASSRAPEVRGQTPTPDGLTNAGAASESRSDRTGHSAVARAKRARVLRKRPPGLRGQPPRPRARSARRPVRTRAQGRPSSGRRRATVRAVRKEWEPGAALVGALGRMPLRPRMSPGVALAGLEPHLLEEALGELRSLGQWRGLSEREEKRREALEALMALMAAVERGEEAPGQ